MMQNCNGNQFKTDDSFRFTGHANDGIMWFVYALKKKKND